MGKFTKFIFFLLTSCVVLAVVILCVGVWFFFTPAQKNAQDITFIVPKGDSISTVAQKLAAQGILRSPLALRVFYKIDGNNKPIQPGTYKLSASQSPKEILTTLFSETQDVWITIKEGVRSEEIASEVAQKLNETFDPDEFITLAKPVEGKLFPDTYLFSKEMDAAAVFSQLTRTFETRYAKAVEEEGAGSLSKQDTIILASLVEREGKGEKDSRIVAGIIKNRLQLGMPLQIDATLQYARGYDDVKQTWWGAPKVADKESESLFNTYKRAGLPPSPICNPGLLSLRAALSPQETDYLYYLHDSQGTGHYARTYDEHLQNIDLYLR